MNGYRVEWEQPGDPLYDPPRELWRYQPLVCIRDDFDNDEYPNEDAAAWPTPFWDQDLGQPDRLHYAALDASASRAAS